MKGKILKRGGYAPSKTPLIVTFKDLRAGFASLRLSLITTTLKSGEEILERGFAPLLPTLPPSPNKGRGAGRWVAIQSPS